MKKYLLLVLISILVGCTYNTAYFKYESEAKSFALKENVKVKSVSDNKSENYGLYKVKYKPFK